MIEPPRNLEVFEMKRVLAVLVVACLLVTHYGCNGKTTESGGDDPPAKSASGEEEHEGNKDEKGKEPLHGPDGEKMDQDPTPTPSSGQEGSEGNDSSRSPNE